MRKPKDSFKITWNDVEWSFDRASGAGGQNVNKRSTKARCVHRPSGAVGVSQIHREQRKNREEAFMQMARTPEFQRWARTEAARRAGTLIDIDAEVERQMNPKNIRVEVKEDGRWVEDKRPQDITP